MSDLQQNTEQEFEPTRAQRVLQIRSARQGRLSTFLPALALIVFGVLLLIHPVELSPALLLGGAFAAAGLSFLVRFALSERREAGNLFIGLLILGVLLIVALGESGIFAPIQPWPLWIGVAGVAALLTGLLATPQQGRLFMPALLLLTISATVLVFTLASFPTTLLNVVRVLWPLLLILFALALLPRVIRADRG